MKSRWAHWQGTEDTNQEHAIDTESTAADALLALSLITRPRKQGQLVIWLRTALAGNCLSIIRGMS